MALPARSAPPTPISLAHRLPGARRRGTGSAIVICPGGGYAHLALDYEGAQVAQWLNSIGVAAFVLQYRLGPRYHHPIELGDAQRAIRTVRAKAAQYACCRTASASWAFPPRPPGIHRRHHFDPGNPVAADAIDRVSSRPDFAVLAYPVISFTTSTCTRIARQSAGPNPDPKLVESLSNELQVTPRRRPRSFSTQQRSGRAGGEQRALYLALRKAGVPAEMHIYEQGRTASAWRQLTKRSPPGLPAWPIG